MKKDKIIEMYELADAYYKKTLFAESDKELNNANDYLNKYFIGILTDLLVEIEDNILNCINADKKQDLVTFYALKINTINDNFILANHPIRHLEEKSTIFVKAYQKNIDAGIFTCCVIFKFMQGIFTNYSIDYSNIFKRIIKNLDKLVSIELPPEYTELINLVPHKTYTFKQKYLLLEKFGMLENEKFSSLNNTKKAELLSIILDLQPEPIRQDLSYTSEFIKQDDNKEKLLILENRINNAKAKKVKK